MKQNTGLAFLASTGAAVAVLTVYEACRRRPFAGYIWLLAGAISGLLAAVLLIHLTVGLESYVYWTVHYTGSRRLPRPGDMLSIYREHTQVWWWVPAFMAGFLLLRWMPRGRCLQAFSISLLMSVPFVRVLVSQFTGEDSSDRAELLLALWPFMLIVAAICALSGLRQGAIAVASVLPFVVIGTVHGALMSQQLWGSTYAIWPLLMILMATSFANLAGSLKYQSTKILMPWILLATLALIVSGGFYVRDHERLNYVDLSGDLTRSKLPALSGLSVPGPWVPEFEQLLRYTEEEIPRSDGLLMIPGEDLFYYATGRGPQFPVLVSDYTVNPYPPDQILELTRSRNIRWLVVKRRIQLHHDPVADRGRLLGLLMQDFRPVKSLDNYDVYRRKTPSF